MKYNVLLLIETYILWLCKQSRTWNTKSSLRAYFFWRNFPVIVMHFEARQKYFKLDMENSRPWTVWLKTFVTFAQCSLELMWQSHPFIWGQRRANSLHDLNKWSDWDSCFWFFLWQAYLNTHKKKDGKGMLCGEAWRWEMQNSQKKETKLHINKPQDFESNFLWARKDKTGDVWP